MTSARQAETELIAYCARVARGAAHDVTDPRQANVLAVAARVLSRRFLAEIAHLDTASERYLRTHEHERVSTAAAIRNGWIVSLPRLRELLTREIEARRRSNGRSS